MNPDFPHTFPAPNDPEARLTAFLLGELSPGETAEVQRELDQNPELAKLHSRLARTIEFVREASKQPDAPAETGEACPRLSNERRDALLTAFKTLRPFPNRAGWKGFWHTRRRLALALAAGVMVLLTAGFVFVRRSAQRASMEMAAARVERGIQLARSQLVEPDAGGPIVAYSTDGRTVQRGPALTPQLFKPDAAGRPVALADLSESERARGGRASAAADAAAAGAHRRTMLASAATASGPQPSAPGVQGGTAPETAPQPMMDVRMMMRYGLHPKGFKLAQSEGGAEGAVRGDFDGDALLAVPEAPARAGTPERAPTASPAPGALLKAKAQDKAVPANALHDWFAVATNRAAEPEMANGTFGYALNNWGMQPARSSAGLASAGGAAGQAGGFGGLGGGGGGFGGGGGGQAFGQAPGAALGNDATPAGFGAQTAQEGRSAGAFYFNRAAQVPSEAPPATTPAEISAASPAPAQVEGTPAVLSANQGVLGMKANDGLVDFAAPSDTTALAQAPWSEAVPPPPTPTATPMPDLSDRASARSRAAGVPILGDVPTLGRTFRAAEPLRQAVPELELARQTDQTAPTRGRSLALGLEKSKQIEDLEPLPLQLPVPAFMGTPTDIPLGTRPATVEPKPWADFDNDGAVDVLAAARPAMAESKTNASGGGYNKDDAQRIKPVTVTGSLMVRDAEQQQAPAQPAARPPGLVAAGKPTERASENLYFDNLAAVAEPRERSLAEAPTVERYDEALFSKGLTALRDETMLGESLARRPAPAPTAGTPRTGDELRRKMSVVADAKDSGRLVEEAKKEAVVEQLVEAEQVARPNDSAVKAGLVEAKPAQEVNRPVTPPPVPQPEIATALNNFSTFSLNVADVSFKLAAASLEAGNLPDPASIRVEEFVNAFNYRDPAPVGDAPIAFDWERAQYPFAHNREVLRFSVQTAAQGREAGRPLNLVLLLDNSGSMERADRVSIIREALQVLGNQLQPQDQISVVAFARNARLWVDALPGNQAAELPDRVGNLTPEGGTNLEDALKTGYETARRHYRANGVNRVVLLTDGAANLGEVAPDSLKQMVEQERRRGIALDCFGIGWDGYNDDLLEVLSRNGDGRYGFVNTAEEAATGFANQLAGALQVAASDVKAQVEFNPARVSNWRQIGYAKHQLTKEQFRDNTVDAAEIGAAEAGNALYVVEVNPQGQGPLGTMRVRYRVPTTGQYRESEWPLEYNGPAVSQERASASMRLATTAAAFGEMLSDSPYAAEVNSGALRTLLGDAPHAFVPDPRPAQLAGMLRQAQSIGGR